MKRRAADDCKRWLIYGANGYTGALIAEEAAKRGLDFVVAGRSRAKLAQVVFKVRRPLRLFKLYSAEMIVPHLHGIGAVLNCAGPFKKTAGHLMRACIEAGVHYLDITGEIPVIEEAASLDVQAQAANVALLPAVGFDVVPTDCLAGMLSSRLPDASLLQLAISAGDGGVSRGTARTSLRIMGIGGAARINGKITRVKSEWKTRDVPFRSGTLPATTIPWGDVASAYYSTGIPNIETYLGMRPKQLRRWRRLAWLSPFLRLPFGRAITEKIIVSFIEGPSAERRAATKADIWGRVANTTGHSVEATMQTPNGYSLTVDAAIAAVERLLNEPRRAGFFTPSKAFGADFALSLPGVSMAWANHDAVQPA